MSTISKIAVVIVILVIIFVVSRLLAGYFNDNYGWNFYLNANDKKKVGIFKEYHSGNVAAGSDPHVIYTNDHALGKLYSTRLGGEGVSPDKVLWTKMHSDEAGYPNPTKRTELRRFNNTGAEEASVSIEAAGIAVGPNGAIIQPGSFLDYNVNLYKSGESLPSSVIGVKGGVKYRFDGADYTTFDPSGTVTTTFADGSKKVHYKDGRVGDISPNGDVSTKDPNTSTTTTTTDGPAPDPAPTTGETSETPTTPAEPTSETSAAPEGIPDVAAAEGFGNFNLVDFNVDAFVADGGFAEIYSKQRREQGGRPKDTFTTGRDFSDIYSTQRKEQGGRPKDTFTTGRDFSDIYSAQRKDQGGRPKDTFSINDSLGYNENFDIESEIGVVEPTSTKFLHEIGKENLVVDDYVRSDRVMLDSNGNLGLVGTGAVPSGSEGFLSSQDKYYVDVEGNQIYRRRRFTATNDNFHGWNGPYVDAYGNIHYDGFFEPVRGARTVEGWFLPPERLQRIKRGTKVTKTWTPHNHALKIHTEPRFYDSSFNSSVQEVLTDSVLRYNPVGNLIVKAQPSFDSLYLLE